MHSFGQLCCTQTVAKLQMILTKCIHFHIECTANQESTLGNARLSKQIRCIQFDQLQMSCIRCSTIGKSKNQDLRTFHSLNHVGCKFHLLKQSPNHNQYITQQSSLVDYSRTALHYCFCLSYLYWVHWLKLGMFFYLKYIHYSRKDSHRLFSYRFSIVG